MSPVLLMSKRFEFQGIKTHFKFGEVGINFTVSGPVAKQVDLHDIQLHIRDIIGKNKKDISDKILRIFSEMFLEKT